MRLWRGLGGMARQASHSKSVRVGDRRPDARRNRYGPGMPSIFWLLLLLLLGRVAFVFARKQGIREAGMSLWALVWLGAALLGLVVLEVVFQAFADVCDETRQSANTFGGWLVVGVAVLGPAAVGWWLSQRRRWRWLVAVAACVQFAAFAFAILPQLGGARC